MSLVACKEKLITKYAHHGIATWLILYSKLSNKTWIGAIGVKGNHTAAAKMENVFPNDEDDENLMYLQRKQATIRKQQNASG